MFAMARRRRVAIALISVVSLTAAPARSHAQAAEKPKNLKVLPADLTRDSVVKFMRFVVASGLGVSCSYCHGAPNVPFDSVDFASDERPTKRTAREMLRMVARINVRREGPRDRAVSPSAGAVPDLQSGKAPTGSAYRQGAVVTAVARPPSPASLVPQGRNRIEPRRLGRRE